MQINYKEIIIGLVLGIVGSIVFYHFNPIIKTVEVPKIEYKDRVIVDKIPVYTEVIQNHYITSEGKTKENPEDVKVNTPDITEATVAFYNGSNGEKLGQWQIQPGVKTGDPFFKNNKVVVGSTITLDQKIDIGDVVKYAVRKERKKWEIPFTYINNTASTGVGREIYSTKGGNNAKAGILFGKDLKEKDNHIGVWSSWNF